VLQPVAREGEPGFREPRIGLHRRFVDLVGLGRPGRGAGDQRTAQRERPGALGGRELRFGALGEQWPELRLGLGELARGLRDRRELEAARQVSRRRSRQLRECGLRAGEIALREERDPRPVRRPKRARAHPLEPREQRGCAGGVRAPERGAGEEGDHLRIGLRLGRGLLERGLVRQRGRAG
jgi:hypothetical protein